MSKALKQFAASASFRAGTIGVLGVTSALVLGLGPAAAHQQGPKLHLGDAPSDQRIDAITYCDGTYRVTTKAGSPIEYREFDLRFKTDSGPDGPKPGTAVVVKAGMRGDRAFVIFSAPGEISGFIKNACRGS